MYKVEEIQKCSVGSIYKFELVCDRKQLIDRYQIIIIINKIVLIEQGWEGFTTYCASYLLYTLNIEYAFNGDVLPYYREIKINVIIM